MTTLSPLTGQSETHDSSSQEEVNGAKQVSAALHVAMKNLGLYPEDHANTKNFLKTVKSSLDDFLNQYGELRFHVSRDSLLYQDQLVTEGHSGTEALAHLLYRDGILWLEFKPGLTEAEIVSFFKLVNQYKTTVEDPEGDLVTALWEKNLPHIDYEATDALYGGEQSLFDFSFLTDLTSLQSLAADADSTKIFHPSEPLPEPDQEDDRSTEDQNRGKAEQSDDPASRKNSGEEKGLVVSIAAAGTDSSLWHIDDHEKRAINRMVRHVEIEDHTADVVKLLVIILKREDDQHNFSLILEYLADEFRDALEQHDFMFAHQLLKNLYEIKRTRLDKKPWALPLLTAFLDKISSAKILDVLVPQADRIETLATIDLKLLAQILISLKPNAIETLGRLLPLLKEKRTMRLMEDIVYNLAQKDMTPLENLLDNQDRVLCRKIIPVLAKLEGKRPLDILQNKMLKHPSKTVRREALIFLIERKKFDTTAILPLVNDPNDGIRLKVLNHLSSTRDAAVEDFMRKHIRENHSTLKDRNALISCYRTLGRCGSKRSVPFLKETLLGKPWKSVLRLGSQDHREGAAIALALINSEESLAVIKEASASRFPQIRAAVQQIP